MKIHLALLSLFAVPTLALAITRPDGTLGVNGIKGFGTYYNNEYRDGNDYDYAGGGVGINQNLYNDDDYGFDVGMEYMYLTSQDDNQYDQGDGRYYTLRGTLYKKGAFSPFFSVQIDYDTTSGYGYEHYDETYAGGAIGVECHLLPGWYVTPKVLVETDLQSDRDIDNETYTAFSLATGYWITSHFNVFADANYSHFNGSNDTWFDAGITVHY